MLGSRIRDLREAARDDDNLNRFLSLTRVYVPRLPKASVEYLVAKVPVVQWSSKYSFSWLWSDLVAGKSVIQNYYFLYNCSYGPNDRDHDRYPTRPPKPRLCQSRKYSCSLWPPFQLATDLDLHHHGNFERLIALSNISVCQT